MNKSVALDNRESTARYDRLIFVYNADGGLAQGMIDALHKVLSPATYPCSLCAITYGAVSMKPRWRAWLATQTIPVTFYHRDDLPYPVKALPAVLAERGGVVTTLLDADQLNGLSDLEALIATLEAALN